MRAVLGLLGAVSLAAPAAAAPQRDGLTPDAVARDLRDRYPVAYPRSAGQLHFEPGTKVAELVTPALRRADPGLRVYRTSLTTGHFEYPEVRAAVVAWVEKGRLTTAACLSADYSGPTAPFTGRLRGLRGGTAKERAAIAADICQVLAEVTPGGRVRSGRLDGDEYQAELWQGDRLWRRIRVPFDTRGAVAGLELVKPSAPPK